MKDIYSRHWTQSMPTAGVIPTPSAIPDTPEATPFSSMKGVGELTVNNACSPPSPRSHLSLLSLLRGRGGGKGRGRGRNFSNDTQKQDFHGT